MSKTLTTLDTTHSSTSAVIDSVVHVTKNIKYHVLELNSYNSDSGDMQYKDWINLGAIVVLPITLFLLQAKAKANKENKEYKSVRRKSYNKLKLISYCIESEIESLKETIIKFEKPETVHIVGTVLTIPFDEFKSIPEGIIEDVYFHKLMPLKNHSLALKPEQYGTEIDGLYKNIETLYCMYKDRIEYTQKCSDRIVEFNKRYAAITYKIIPIVSRIKDNESGNIPDEIVNIAVSGNKLYYKDDKSRMKINFSNIFNTILNPIAKEIKKKYPNKDEMKGNEDIYKFWEYYNEWGEVRFDFSNFHLSSKKDFTHILNVYEGHYVAINKFIALHKFTTYKKKWLSF